jgi:hypothetical protein
MFNMATDSKLQACDVILRGGLNYRF